MADTATYSKGLAGVYICESEICPVGWSDIHDILYFGYPLCEMSEIFSFDEVAYLLLHKAWPSPDELSAFRMRVSAARELDTTLKQALELMPASTPPMDMMRTACSFIGMLRPEESSPTLTDANADAAVRAFEYALGALPSAMLYWHHFHSNGQRVETRSLRADESVSEHMLRVLHGNDSPIAKSTLAVRALDGSLILYAEHEMTASTFASRLCASTLSDVWSCLTGAIGVLKGPLHGGANEAAYKMLVEWKDAETATQGVKSKVANKELLFGFGHRVYMKKGDPRSPYAKKFSKALSVSTLPDANPCLVAVSEAAEEAMVQEKGIKTNLDYYTASLYAQLGIPVGLFTPIFAVSRTTGWASHILEQRSHNRLMRPSCIYTGKAPQSLPGSVVFSAPFGADRA